MFILAMPVHLSKADEVAITEITENEDEQADELSDEESYIITDILIKSIAQPYDEELVDALRYTDRLKMYKTQILKMSLTTDIITSVYTQYASSLSLSSAAPATTTKAPVYTVTDKEYDILCHIVEAEATDGTLGQKQNVASNIFTRVENSEWPNSIEKVVFQKGQYSPLLDGRYYSVKVTDSTKQAVDYIIENGIIFTDDKGIEHTDLRFNYFCSYGCKSSFMAGFDKKLAAKGKECFRDGIHRYYE